jgi:hypothetical protein
MPTAMPTVMHSTHEASVQNLFTEFLQDNLGPPAVHPSYQYIDAAIPFDESSLPLQMALDSSLQKGLSTLDDSRVKPNSSNGLTPREPRGSQPELSNKSTPESSWQCKWEGCTYAGSFGRESDLLRHLRTKHISPGMHRCPWAKCPRVFNRKDKMREHVRQAHERTEEVIPSVKVGGIADDDASSGNST